MSSILKWMIVLMLLIAVAGGGGAYWFYIRSDELLRAEILKHLAKMAPDLQFGIERANFDLSGRVRLQGLTILLPGEAEPALYIPETVVTLDEQKLTSFENIVIQKLRFVQPQLRAIRKTDGRWNWQAVMIRSDGSRTIPGIEIEYGTVAVELQRNRGPAKSLKLSDLNVSAVPAAARRLKVALSSRIDPAGPLSATVDFDLAGPPWKIEAKWSRLPIDDGLMDLVGEFSATASEKLQLARRAMVDLAARQTAAVAIPQRDSGQGTIEAIPTATQIQSRIETQSHPAAPPFGLRCECDLHVRLQQADKDSPIEFQALAQLQGGQVSNVLLPFPLYELRGSLYADRHQAIIRDLHAENGATRVSLDARLASNHAPRLNLRVRNLEIDDALKSRLSGPMQKLINSLSLTGRCDLDLDSRENNGNVAWEGSLKLAKGFVAHEKFPYPIRDVSGAAHLRNGKIDVVGQGTAGGVPIRLTTGWVMNPGPANESLFVIQADAVPINSMLLDACPPPVRNAITELNLQGRQDVRLQISKLAGVGQKYKIHAAMKLRDCSCSFKGFPYLISHLQGLVIWDEDIITFKDLRGQHDATVITGAGVFHRQPEPGHLDLSIQAENAAFDRSLEAALTPALSSVWREFQPVGRFDVDSKITWIPGQPCEVVLPRISVADAEITMQSFPWPLQSVQGEFSYEAPLLTLKSFRARHDDTQIHGRGIAVVPSGMPWRVRFDELHVDDLSPNASFRKALPQQLKQVSDVLNPAGKFSISTNRSGCVVLAGGDPSSTSLSAAWDVQVLLSDCELTAGIRIEDIHGRIDLKGETDGERTALAGQLDLDSISVFREPSGLAHQITRVTGPIKLLDGQFTAGSRTLFAKASRAALGTTVNASEESIRGDAIDGKLTLDAFADLRENPEFRVGLTLSRGRLERYAQQYLLGQSGLAGIMNGWIYLSGHDDRADQIQGRGALQIAPAALYELPLIVQIFRTLQLDAADRTAFDRADLVFNLNRGRFNFETIDLVGKTISLRGRGYVRLDGTMQLDFYSMLARSQIRIPVLHELAGMLSRGWVGVKVTGQVGDPQTRVVPVPEFDEAFKLFLGSFDPLPPPPPPNDNRPRTGQRPSTQPQ